MLRKFGIALVVFGFCLWEHPQALAAEVPSGSPTYDSIQARVFRNYKSLYLQEGGQGNWGKALALALESGAYLSEQLSLRERADWIYDLGYLYDMNEDYGAALSHYQRSLVLYEAIHDPETLDLSHDMALVYNNIGVVHAHTGFFTERLKAYHKARELWEQVPDLEESYLLTAYGNLMRLYAQYGDRDGARDLLRALDEHFQNWLDRGGVPEAIHYINKHRIHLLYTEMRGDKVVGQQQLDSLLRHFEMLSSDQQRQYSSHLLTAIQSAAGPFDDYSRVGERRQKKAYLDRALDESLRLGDRYNQMIAHSRLCSYYLEAEEDPHRAMEALDKALKIGEEIDIRVFNRMNLLLKKAALLQQKERFPEAEELVLEAVSSLLDQSVEQASVLQIEDFAHRNDVFYIEALKQMGVIYQEEFEREGLQDYGRQALHFFDLAARLFHIYYQKGVYNPSLNALNAAINEGLLSLHLRLGLFDAAALLDLIERNRSQHLAKEFDAKHLRFLNVPDSLFVQRNLLHLALGKMGASAALSPPEEGTYARLQDSLQVVEAQIREKDRHYFPFFSDSISITDIQSTLKEGQVLVRYLLASENLFAFVVNREQVLLKDLGSQEQLQERVLAYHEALQNIQSRVSRDARALYRDLVAPLDLEPEKLSALVFIPDNFLNFLPFETLIDSATGLPMVARCALSYSYGLRLWYLQERAVEGPKQQGLFAAFAPRYSPDYFTSLGGSRLQGNNRLQNLVGAAREAEAISRQWSGALFAGAEATKEAFLARTIDYKIYHFAMHALMDERQPHHSSLVFQDEEHLHYHELYGLHFPAELVVLSACNTGMGRLETGEGLMSLSRALTYSGVRSAIYSLWEVPDEETAVLMQLFYRYLIVGKSKAEALALAKREFLEAHPMKSHPFFWAGFVVNGHAGPVVALQKSSWWWCFRAGWILAALSVLVLGWRTFFHAKGAPAP